MEQGRADFVIRLSDEFGSFAADGVKGNLFRGLRVESVWPAARRIVFDLDGVAGMTDSFAYGLFGNLAAEHGQEMVDRVRFEHATPLVRDMIISAVQAGLEEARHERP